MPSKIATRIGCQPSVIERGGRRRRFPTYDGTHILRQELRGPMNLAYRLATQELLTLFHPLRILVYREEGRVEDTTCGLRNEAILVAQKACNSDIVPSPSEREFG